MTLNDLQQMDIVSELTFTAY